MSRIKMPNDTKTTSDESKNNGKYERKMRMYSDEVMKRKRYFFQ